jgi:peptidoglycan/xylan/chitin deacetylase (PgdA/CDA1 family)
MGMSSNLLARACAKGARGFTRGAGACLPWAALRWLTGSPAVVLYYHVVSDVRVPHVTHLFPYRDARRFRDDLEFFSDHFRPIGVPELIEYLERGIMPPRDSALLTFDDGMRECHDVIAPALKAVGLPGAFFLTTDFLDNQRLFHRHKVSLILDRLAAPVSEPVRREVQRILGADGADFAGTQIKLLSLGHDAESLLDTTAKALGMDFGEYLRTAQPYLTGEQVQRLLADGFTVGAHGLDHQRFSLLSLEEQLRQTSGSVAVLEQRFGIRCRAFAFPHDDAGVGESYFIRAVRETSVAVFFGSGGMGQGKVPRCLERVCMDDACRPAGRILRDEYRARWGEITRDRWVYRPRGR